MKGRIRSIFWLMAACILGINGFQAYWLYKTYQLTGTQYQRTVREALATTVQQQLMAGARQLVNGPGGRSARIVVRNFRTGDGGSTRIVLVPTDSNPATPARLQRHFLATQEHLALRTRDPEPAGRGRRISLEADTVARNISRILLDDWAGGTKVDLRQLTAQYRRELRLRGADAEVRLDTLTVQGPLALSGTIPNKPAPPGFTVQTPPVPLNPLRSLYVQASLPPPTFYILRQMSGLLAGSALLLVLTTGCFGLMISTILKQKKLSEVKNDFINNMTHELKTPLATVSAAVEALQHFGALHDAQKTQTYLNISRHELQRLSDLVEKVLNIAVEERQTLTLNPELVRPAELVSELVTRHQLKAPKPVQFEVDIPAADTVRLDPLHVGNVINNLIDNAIKYSREQVRIAIRGQHEAGGWRLTVQDDGIGIPRSYQDAIFDRFFRVPTGNLHPVKGFGLGLYYVRQVVERHGGHIQVRSEPNRGSEFTLWLPG